MTNDLFINLKSARVSSSLNFYFLNFKIIKFLSKLTFKK
ncbi:hypothetical protein UNSW3_960 [Campylobacter concisus UNSW3]|uniref:Uncharacterized protein n=1 Tax=Campylobacter concisus UNSW3 TaxID=1242966 RepID=U2F129_9BACT|nr:hypothetical protein UNSW3_960 [Campylobacter concisus UNSW3]